MHMESPMHSSHNMLQSVENKIIYHFYVLLLVFHIKYNNVFILVYLYKVQFLSVCYETHLNCLKKNNKDTHYIF